MNVHKSSSWLLLAAACGSEARSTEPPVEALLVAAGVPLSAFALAGAGASAVQTNGRVVVYQTLAADPNQRCFDPAGDSSCNYDLMSYDLATGVTQPLADTPFREEAFVVDGDDILWIDYEDDLNNGCTDLASDTDCARALSARPIAGGERRRRRFDVLADGALSEFDAEAGRILAAVVSANGIDIVYYEHLDAAPRVVATGPDFKMSVRLEGDWAVWTDRSHDSDEDCYGTSSDRDCFITVQAYDLVNDVGHEVVTLAGPFTSFPTVCGTTVIVSDHTRDANGDCLPPPDDCVIDLTAIDLVSGESRTLVAGGIRGTPVCDDGDVVFLKREGDSNNGCFSPAGDTDCGNVLWHQDLGAGEPTPLSDSRPYRFPDLGGGVLVFQEMSYGCAQPVFDEFCQVTLYARPLP